MVCLFFTVVFSGCSKRDAAYLFFILFMYGAGFEPIPQLLLPFIGLFMMLIVGQLVQ
jgi:hypothetical protein